MGAAPLSQGERARVCRNIELLTLDQKRQLVQIVQEQLPESQRSQTKIEFDLTSVNSECQQEIKKFV